MKKFDFSKLKNIFRGSALRQKISEARPDFQKAADTFQSSGRYFFLFALALVFFMGLICVVVFFLSVKGYEEVMVPRIVGKDLPSALIEMQQKELYPKIQLRYSDLPDEKGTVLEQQPAGGSIVKAGARIQLVVSRGVVLDKIETYTGQLYDEVKSHLQTLFASSSRPLVALDNQPLYKFDNSPEGTVLEQDPLPDTPISDPVTLKLVVSRGPVGAKSAVPQLVGLALSEMYEKMSRSRLVFDFSSRPAEVNEISASVVSQLPEKDQLVASNSHIAVVLAMPSVSTDGLVYGIYSTTLPSYSYPVELAVSVLSDAGEKTQLVKFFHTGGKVTIPYAQPRQTVLVLSVQGVDTASFIVQ